MSCFFASLFYPTLFSGHPSHIGLVSSYYCLIDFSWLGLGPRAIRKLLFLSSAFTVREAVEEKLFYLASFWQKKSKNLLQIPLQKPESDCDTLIFLPLKEQVIYTS